MLNIVWERILNLVYPRRCPICNDVVMPHGQMICPACTRNLPVLQEPRCVKCSKELGDESREYCMDCEKTKHIWEQGLAAFRYDNCMQQSIVLFKYHGRKEYGSFYAKELVFRYRVRIERWNAQAIIPVPLHLSKLRLRGFNQAAELSNRMSDYLGIPVWEAALLRTRKTRPQKQLNDQERVTNLEGAFAINPVVREELSRLRRVILVDDIYTTGSTLDACAKVLKECGIQEVFFLTICIGSGY